VVQRQPRRDGPARGLARACLHVTAVGAYAFAHAGQAAADAPPPRERRFPRLAVADELSGEALTPADTIGFRPDV
jgi:hypothetical protein